MTGPTDRKFRQGNLALDYLIAHEAWSNSSHTEKFMKELPDIAVLTFQEALSNAEKLFTEPAIRELLHEDGSSQDLNENEHLPPLSPEDQASLITHCLFDLQLTSYFGTLCDLNIDNSTASILIDALLYQTMGCETKSASENELLFHGTQGVRGIDKFLFAKNMFPTIGDIEGWVFGKEFGMIMLGEAPFDYILATSCFSIIVRVEAGWHMRFLLTGAVPTTEDYKRLERLTIEAAGKMDDIVSKLRAI